MEEKQQKKESFVNVFKHYFRKEEALLIPNILCYFRILLVIVYVILYLTPFTLCGNEYANVYFAFAVIVIASYTDFIDGFIARTFNMRSNLGKVLDPIADKLLQAAIAITLCFCLKGLATPIVMFIVFALKEITLMIQDVILARNNRSLDGAKWYGKLSSFLFYLILAILVLLGPSLQRNATMAELHAVVDPLCSVAILFLAIAWVMYTIDVHKILKNKTPLVVKEEEKHD